MQHFAPLSEPPVRLPLRSAPERAVARRALETWADQAVRAALRTGASG